MPIDDRMTVNERRKYLKLMRPRYAKAGRAERGGLLREMETTLVRSYLGYDRLDTLRQCEAVNALYDQLWLYYNLFQPVLPLVGKEVVDGKLKRRWDRAQTPYQRLLASGVLSEVQQARLATLYAATSPRQLREDIYHAVERRWQRPPQAQNGPMACAPAPAGWRWCMSAPPARRASWASSAARIATASATGWDQAAPVPIATSRSPSPTCCHPQRR